MIARGDGEETIVQLKHALNFDALLDSNRIASRREGIPNATQAAETIVRLDDDRIG